MDIEKLNKQQIILITLLVSFVTSIATGIVTVALMDQAPAGVTQTINRVVERTIEKVVPTPEASNNTTVITKETIVVSEDDKITESIAQNKDSVVRIYVDNADAGDVAEQKAFVGLGTVMTKDGLIATGDVFADTRGRYLITMDDNVFYNVSVLPKKDSEQFYFLRVNQNRNNPVSFTPVTLADSDSLKLGQAVIAWGGQMESAVSTGIISSLIRPQGADGQTASTTKVSALNANIDSLDSLPGSPLLNLSGETVGIRVSANISTTYGFLPSNALKKDLTAVLTR